MLMLNERRITTNLTAGAGMGVNAKFFLAIGALIVLALIGTAIFGRPNDTAPAATTALSASAVPATALLPTVTSPASPPAASAAPSGPVGKVGERIEVKSVGLIVNSVKTATQQGQFTKPKAGSQFVVVDVTLDNPWTAEEPYNPFYFKVKDSENFEYSVGFGADRALQSGDLKPGEKARGELSFEVPTKAKGLVLSYKPVVIAGGYEPIQVDLGL